jgi:ATP-dependent Clp protease ATP-binding subunit ClpC
MQKSKAAVPFTPRVKRTLLTAQKEARELNHAYVGTEHVLLGLLAENDGVASRVLERLGLCLSQTRQEILKELDPNRKGEQPSQG